MVRYWAIAPSMHKPFERFERCWQYDRDNGIIAIGWDVGAPESRDDLKRKYEEVASRMGRRDGWGQRGLQMLAKFWYEIRIGDQIIARAGRKKIVGVGTVTGQPYYDEDGDRFTWGCNFLPVRWDSLGEKMFPELVFPMDTIIELQETRFEQLTSVYPWESP